MYSGQVRHFLREGTGVHVYANGDKYDGQWVDDKRHGTGTSEHDASLGKLLLHGQGRFEGTFVDDAACGEGNFVDAYGNTYSPTPGKGGFKNGELFGEDKT